MQRAKLIKLSLPAFIAGALIFQSGPLKQTTAAQAHAGAVLSVQEPVKPKRISTAELRKLRWIEGAWRGTGDVEAPFYERYRFEGDSTLVVESFPDETLSKITDVTRFELKDGAFGNTGESSLWAATELTDDYVTFEPTARARNTFRWQRESKNVWKAILNWPALGDKPARERVYKMERLPEPKR